MGGKDVFVVLALILQATLKPARAKNDRSCTGIRVRTWNCCYFFVLQ